MQDTTRLLCILKVKQSQVEASNNHERELQPICPSHPWKHMGIDIISDFGSDSDERHIFVVLLFKQIRFMA